MDIGEVGLRLMEEKGFVYILSCVNESYYLGSTKDVERRFLEHVEGRVVSTKNIRPVKLVFSQEFATIADARRIEYRLKQLKSKIIIQRIVKEQCIKMK
jgi:predicted GIY-YIG superfamily endonuclease